MQMQMNLQGQWMMLVSERKVQQEEWVQERGGKTELCMKRAEKAEAKRRAAMWAAQDRKRGMGWSEEVETASRPVMPVGMSSMRLSPGRLRLGVEGLEGLEAPRMST